MMKKTLTVISCAMLAVCMLAFTACSQKHVHDDNTATDKTTITTDEGVFDVYTCTECGEEIKRERTAHFIANGILVSDAETSKITVKTADGLKNFNAIMTNTYTPAAPYTSKLSKKSMSGKTIYLGDNIDISGYVWTPIDLDESVSSLTIDGLAHKIVGLTLDGKGIADGDSKNLCAMFGRLNTTLTVKNVTFENAVLTTTGSWSGFVVGRQIGGIFTGERLVFNNCEISASPANLSIRLGSIIGHCNLRAGAKVNLAKCRVTDSKFKGYHNVCGLIGTLDGAQAFESSWSITGCAVTNNKFYIGVTNPMYVNPFTCDTSYLEREPMESYIEKNGAAGEKKVNAQSGNEFFYGVE